MGGGVEGEIVGGGESRISKVYSLVGVVVLVVIGVAVWNGLRPSPPLPPPRPPAPAVSSGTRSVVPGWGEGALAAWNAFVKAPTVEGKLAHVLDAGRVAPAMRAYYARRPEADAGLGARVFTALPGTPEDRQRGILVLGSAPKSPGDRPMLVFLRTTPPGRGETAPSSPPSPFLIDWETFIQERDGLVEAFLRDMRAPKRTFRLAVERAHVFEGGSPEAAEEAREPLGFRLRTPSGVSMGQVAALSPDSPLHARLTNQLRWGMTAYATLQLVWEPGRDGTPELRVGDFVCWHFPGLGGRPEFEADLSPLPPELRPGAP